MPERMALSPTLWLIVAPPAVALAWQLVARTRRAAAGDASDPWAARVGVGSALIASGATLGHALRLARASAGVEAFVQPGAGAAHGGPLDGASGLRFDGLSGAACGLACAVALAAAVLLASRPAAEPRGRAWAWLELALASALLTFLAGGFVTVVLGWTLAAAAAAWLEGWTNPSAGAVRATRGALAILALLSGAALRVDPGPGHATLAVVAFLIAAAAMSASTPPSGAPPALAALACGGTTGLLGPFLLLRLASHEPTLSGVGLAVAGPTLVLAGVAMIAAIGRQALHAPAGPSRWLAVVGGAAPGLTCIALGADGEKGGLLVLVSAGVTSACLLLMAAARGISAAPARTPARPDLSATLFARAPASLGTLLLSFERWVLDAVAGAVVVIAHASAWALSRIDARRS